MSLVSYSYHPNRPCMLLKFPDITVLLDCAVDMTSLSTYLPALFNRSKRVEEFPTLEGPGLPYLRLNKDYCFVDGIPEAHPVSLDTLPMDSVDVILISNWQSLLALPFYTENSGFNGNIYATLPVLQFGRLLMEEMVEYFDSIPGEFVLQKAWKDPSVVCRIPNPPLRNPLEWKEWYTKGEMESALARVTAISFRDPVKCSCGGITIFAAGSGYSIGSCNWVLQSEYEKVVYLSSSSSRTSHTRSLDKEALMNADSMIVTSLSKVPDTSPEASVKAMCSTITNTLQCGGNVLLPMSPVGLIYDLLDVIVKTIEQSSGVNIDTPIYFISPVASSAFAYANVNAEWLSESRQNPIYMNNTPDEPFSHASLVKNGRVKLFHSTFEQFSREFKSPCVVIAGHPSLRIGDVPQLLEMWGDNPDNAVIVTDSDYPLHEYYGPFEGLRIRAYYCPIDTRLDFSQLNQTHLAEFKPKMLYVPEQYLKPPHVSRPGFVVDFKPVVGLQYDALAVITGTKKAASRQKRIRVHPDLIKKLEVKGSRHDYGCGLLQLNGVLSVFDDEYELTPPKKKTSIARPTFTGRLTPEQIMRALTKRNLDSRLLASEDDTSTVKIDSLNSTISLDASGLRTTIQCPKEHRPLLADVVTSLLQAL